MDKRNAQNDWKHSEMHVASNGYSIEEFFEETVVFITGATGFVGKALVEKLLRCCPRLATIFILIRPKGGQTIEQRVKTLLDNMIFDRIRSECPKIMEKIVPIRGDVSKPELGLSLQDKMTLLEKVNVVFHSAANVRFDEPLKAVVNSNIKATEQLLELCRSMKNVRSIVYVSTAFSNVDKYKIKELIYTSPVKPNFVMDMCDCLDDDTIAVVEKKLLGKHPNTYTLSKALAEQLILEKGANLPIAVVRPSIVCAAHEEPVPGWLDNTLGITGILMQFMMGTVRSVMCNEKLKMEIIPVDYVVNTLICTAWYTAVNGHNIIKVYNCTNSTKNPLRWGEFGAYMKKHAVESPSKHALWYPNITFRTNRLVHLLVVAVVHYIPALFWDLVLRCQGNKPTMLKITTRTSRLAKMGEFFVTNEFDFGIDNMTELVKNAKMLKDHENFNIDIGRIDWYTYVGLYMSGIKKYILKENIDSSSKARRRLSKLYLINKMIQLFSVIIILGMLKCVGR